MSNKLGEVFFDGRIINLDSAEEQNLNNIVNELEKNQANKKVKINRILDQIREEG